MNLLNPDHQATHDQAYDQEMAQLFQEDSGRPMEKINTFPKYASLSALNNFLARHTLFQQIVTLPGAIIEGGVGDGFGLFAWAKMSAIYEPNHHARRIIGFDTFEGFPAVSSKDRLTTQPGQMRGGSLASIQSAVQLFNQARPLGHIPRVELVPGDVCATIPTYLQANPHLLIALLYLDFDLFDPTVTALEHMAPRILSGGIVAFDELNCRNWPGETEAVLASVGIQGKRWSRLSFHTRLCYYTVD